MTRTKTRTVIFKIGDIITVNLNVWHKFLEKHEGLMVSLWDLVPPDLEIMGIDLVPFHQGGALYLVIYKGSPFWLYEEDLILVKREE
jgi:hypothetical protein